jgi:curved DNA-binding protein CbpA
MEQYFEILKIKSGASIEDVKRAYKVQVKIWHPDRFPVESPRLQKKAHEMFQKITAAYKKISDAHIRHKYSEASGWKGGFPTFPFYLFHDSPNGEQPSAGDAGHVDCGYIPILPPRNFLHLDETL